MHGCSLFCLWYNLGMERTSNKKLLYPIIAIVVILIAFYFAPEREVIERVIEIPKVDNYIARPCTNLEGIEVECKG